MNAHPLMPNPDVILRRARQKQPLPDSGLTKADAELMAMDPTYGPHREVWIDQGRVSLSSGDGNTPIQKWVPTAQNAVSGTEAYITVATVDIPEGYQPLFAEFSTGLLDPQLANGVDFALFIGNNPIKAVRGIVTNFGYPLDKFGKQRREVSIRALVLPIHWTAPAGADPIESDIVAMAKLEVYGISNTTNIARASRAGKA